MLNLNSNKYKLQILNYLQIYSIQKKQMQRIQQHQQELNQRQQQIEYRQSTREKIKDLVVQHFYKIKPILLELKNNRLLTTLLILNLILIFLFIKSLDQSYRKHLKQYSHLQLIVEDRHKISNQTDFTKMSKFGKNRKIYQPKKIQQLSNKKEKQNCQITSINSSYQFALKMLESQIQGNNQSLDCIQRQYFLNKYKIQETGTETRIYIIATLGSYIKNKTGYFLTSLNRQKYKNYQVHLIADMISDDEYNQLIEQLKEYPSVNNRIVISKNQVQIGKLEIFDQVIRSFCKKGDIILHVNAMSIFIGTRFLNLLSFFYSNNDKLWFVYTNHLQYNTQYGQLLIAKTKPGHSKQIPNHKILRFYTEQQVVGPLLSYRYELYLKIPFYYFIDANLNSYYKYISENFLIFALTELAGDSHTKYLNEYLYLYEPQSTQRKQKQVCHRQFQKYEQIKLRSMAHFYPLKYLTSEVQIERNATVSQPILSKMFQNEEILFQCLKINQHGFYSLS